MKKILFFSFASILLLTGCGATETLSCTYTDNANNGTSTISYDIDHVENEIKKVRITYDYNFNNDNNTGNNDNTTGNLNSANENNNTNANHTDGIGTGTDGTTNDTQFDDDGVVDGVIGSAIDTVVGGITGIILDSAGLKDRHATVQNTYGNINGFSVQNTNDQNNKYTVTYVIDYDTISDNDLSRFNLVRNLDDMKNSYTIQGFTCK